MTPIDCSQLADLAPELALGVLTGRERAQALEHLDSCGPCRQLVSSLSGVTDELLRSFAPSVEPPAGFETRVLAAITPPRTKTRNSIPALAAAACVALLVGVAALVGGSSREAFAAAEMRTASGDVVGWIYVDRDDSAVAMRLPGWAEQVGRYGHDGDRYSLRLTDRAGVDHAVPIALDSNASWTASIDIDGDAVAAVALVDDSGRVWCQATLDTA